eukprot:1157179-Pelagomonas_calceolata.AAC.4
MLAREQCSTRKFDFFPSERRAEAWVCKQKAYATLLHLQHFKHSMCHLLATKHGKLYVHA